MTQNVVHFLAILFTALLFAPAAAHMFALMNKIGMSQQDYYVAQLAYRRWDIFGWAYLGALVFAGALAFMSRGQGLPFALNAAAFVLVVLALAIFFIWVFPGNLATRNWTVVPDNWQVLRARWEWGHAGSAIADFLALAALAAAATIARPGG